MVEKLLRGSLLYVYGARQCQAVPPCPRLVSGSATLAPGCATLDILVKVVLTQLYQCL